jgi:hypothetical protein
MPDMSQLEKMFGGQGGGGKEGNLPRLPGAKKPKKFRRF